MVLDTPNITVKQYKEITLTVLEEAVPEDVWRNAKMKTEKFFMDNLGRMLGAPPSDLPETNPLRGEWGATDGRGGGAAICGCYHDPI